MKSIIVFILTLGLAGTLFTAQAEQFGQLYNPNEVGISLYGAVADVEADELGGDGSNWGFGAGVYAFPFQRYLGVQAQTTWRNMEGRFVDNVEANGILRIPFDKYRLAPYAIGGATYDIETEKYVWGVGPGLEYRFNDKWGVFGEYRFYFDKEDVTDEDVNEARFGLRLVF